MVVSLSVLSVLKDLKLTKSYIKWPNDILAGNKKVCGILIENVIKNNKLSASIIGIGLNINQREFIQLPNATSLNLETGQEHVIDQIMDRIMKALRYNFKRLENKKFDTLKNDYEKHLFRKDKPSTFRDTSETIFTGYIKGVTTNGHLKVLLENEEIKDFDLKEIQLMY